MFLVAGVFGVLPGEIFGAGVPADDLMDGGVDLDLALLAFGVRGVCAFEDLAFEDFGEAAFEAGEAGSFEDNDGGGDFGVEIFGAGMLVDGLGGTSSTLFLTMLQLTCRIVKPLSFEEP